MRTALWNTVYHARFAGKEIHKFEVTGYPIKRGQVQ